jgi:hypothetical protein
MFLTRDHNDLKVGDEFSATFVGRLVTTLIQRVGDHLGANLEVLLKAVLSKLSSTKTLSVEQVNQGENVESSTALPHFFTFST